MILIEILKLLNCSIKGMVINLIDFNRMHCILICAQKGTMIYVYFVQLSLKITNNEVRLNIFIITG